MTVVSNKRSVMTLYSEPTDIYCHQVRIVLAEKGVNVEIINMNLEDDPAELAALNPYGSVPTLVDRDLIIYDSRIIMEYLDERFPHPPLMPVYPVARAESRRTMYRFNRDFYSLYERIIRREQNPQDAEQAAKQLEDSIISLEPVFSAKQYFLSEEFSLVDCWLAPLLWRLPSLGIEKPVKLAKVKKYMQRVFERDSFQAGLTGAERDMAL